MRIGIDAMGGDNAPEIVVHGALEARSILEGDDRIVLVGKQEAILQHLAHAEDWSEKIDIRHAEQVVGMDEPPVETLRAKQNSSIAILAQMHANGEVDACISAGNTGAFVAAAQMRLRRLRGVHRPGITVLVSAPNGPVAICDVGANVNCRPLHLYQYGVMASTYIRSFRDVAEPRVKVLSIGEEDAKGNDLVKNARELMKDDPHLNFVGNAEGRDLFRGTCDVLVCEGFVGNVILKLVEGMADGVLQGLLGRLMRAIPQQADGIRAFGENMMRSYDFNEYGGAPLLGVGGICLICHGAANARGIMNAVKGARNLAANHINQQIIDLLSRNQRTVHA